MSSICGWSGTGLGPDMSQQTITAMLKACSGTANEKSDSDFDEASALGINQGLYATSH